MTIISKKSLELAKLRRMKSKLEAPTFDITKYLFKEQLDFVQDTSSNKIAVCSRRSGKTISCAADLMHTALTNPNVVCLYITLSRNNAKKIIWRELENINRVNKLDCKINLAELSFTTPNGSMIYLSGAKDISEIEKFRGLALKLVYIDECQSFRQYIKTLIDDILAPALMDYAGTLCLIGTPGPVPVGYFHDCAEGNNDWGKHKWTFWDNPHLPIKSKSTHQQMLSRELKRRGVTVDDPSIQREFFGKWVLDSNSLLLHYRADLNHFDALPELPKTSKWNYIMGIDLGMDDADAIAVLAWSEQDPNTYLVHEVVTAGQGITELVKQIQDTCKIYDVSKMMIDQGGLGKKIAEEIRRQHSIPVEMADKARKMENVAFLNDAMRTGKFKARSNSRFAQDSYLVEIDKDKTTPDKIKVSSKYHSDIIDSVLYAFKESPAFTYQKPKVKPMHGSPEWARAEQDSLWEKAQEHFESQAELERKLNGFVD